MADTPVDTNAVGNTLYPEVMPPNSPALTPPMSPSASALMSAAPALSGTGQPEQAPSPIGAGGSQPMPGAVAQSIQNPDTAAAKFKGTPFYSVLHALGGGDQVTYKVDPDTGKTVEVTTKPTSGALWKHILAGALTGMAASADTRRGENSGGAAGAFGRAAGAVMQRNQQQLDQGKQDAQGDFQQQQRAQLQRAQVAHANLQALTQGIALGQMDKAAHDQAVASYADQVADLKEMGIDGADKILSEQEAKSAGNIADHVRIPVGTVPRIDPATGEQVKINGVPAWDNTYISVPKDARVSVYEKATQPGSTPNSTVVQQTQTLKPWYKQAQDWGLVSSGSAPLDYPVAAAAMISHQVNALNITQNRLQQFYNTMDAGKKPGDPGYVQAPDLKAALQADPGLKDALLKFQPFAGSSTEPDQQIENFMQKDPQAAAKVMSLFGGGQALQQYKVNRETTEAKNMSRAKAEGSGEFQKNMAEAAKARNADGGAGGIGSIQEAAKNVVDGNLGQLKDLASMRGGQRTQLFNAILAEARARGLDPKKFSPAALESKAKMWVDYSEGKTSDQIAAFDAFLGHANDAMDATANMRSRLRNGSPIINQPLNWIAKNMANDVDYTKFTTALEPVRKEFMNFLNANRAEHESDLKTMQTVLSDTSTPAQIEGALKQLGQSADIRLAALGKKYLANIGTAYPNLVSEEGKQTMQRMGINSQSVALGQQPSGTGQPQSGYSPNNPFATKK